MLRRPFHDVKAFALPGLSKRATQTPHAEWYIPFIYIHPTGHLPLLCSWQSVRGCEVLTSSKPKRLANAFFQYVIPPIRRPCSASLAWDRGKDTTIFWNKQEIWAEISSRLYEIYFWLYEMKPQDAFKLQERLVQSPRKVPSFYEKGGTFCQMVLMFWGFRLSLSNFQMEK